jgi:hypothetical protein
MTRLGELTQRIAAKLKELDGDLEERTRANALLHRTEARIEDLRDELPRARRRIKKRRDAVAAVRDDLDEMNAATPDEETQEELELSARLDELAGQLDEAIAIRDRILDHLDRLTDKREDAKAILEKAIDESKEDREALQRMRARRKRMREAHERDDRPSRHFSWAEFDCNDGTPLPEESKAAVRNWCLVIGEPARARFGSVHINSAFRHRAYNARIGGEDNSVHIYDFPGRNFRAVAVDFSCAQGGPLDWFNFTAGKADGRGRYGTFHHADTRNRIGWPDVTWSG